MRSLSEYKAIILDLDGTLYYQKPVRFAMMKEMIFHFWRLREFFIIRDYRKLYEKGYTEKKRLERLPAEAGKIIQEWMIERPLPYVCHYRDAELIELMRRIMRSGVPVIVYSDYPVREKLHALGFSPDYSFCAEDLGSLKPDARGIISKLTELNISPGDCLVIGDWEDKDGKLAYNMGADVLILPEKKNRLSGYKNLNGSV